MKRTIVRRAIPALAGLGLLWASTPASAGGPLCGHRLFGGHCAAPTYQLIPVGTVAPAPTYYLVITPVTPGTVAPTPTTTPAPTAVVPPPVTSDNGVGVPGPPPAPGTNDGPAGVTPPIVNDTDTDDIPPATTPPAPPAPESTTPTPPLPEPATPDPATSTPATGDPAPATPPPAPAPGNAPTARRAAGEPDQRIADLNRELGRLHRETLAVIASQRLLEAAGELERDGSSVDEVLKELDRRIAADVASRGVREIIQARGLRPEQKAQVAALLRDMAKGTR